MQALLQLYKAFRSPSKRMKQGAGWEEVEEEEEGERATKRRGDERVFLQEEEEEETYSVGFVQI